MSDETHRNEGSAKRVKYSRERKKNDIDKDMENCKCLAILPESSFPFDISAESKQFGNDFFEFVHKDNNNEDVLAAGVLDRRRPCYVSSWGARDKTIKSKNGFEMAWAYAVCRKLKAEHGLRYTLASTFEKGVVDRPEDLARFIGQNFGLVFLVAENEFMKWDHNKDNFEKIFQFYSVEFVRYCVRPFPPLSLVRSLQRKKDMRDDILEELKVPFAYVKVGEWNEAAKEALLDLRQKYGDHDLISDIDDRGMVAKRACGGSAAIHVYFLSRNEHKWVAKTSEGKRVQQMNPSWIEFRFEPYMVNCQKQEVRVFATTSDTASRVTPICSVETDFRNGTYSANISEGKCQGKYLPTIRSAFLKLKESRHPWMNMAHLVLRFDLFHDEDNDKVYLNEVEVLPIAMPFFNEYYLTHKFMERMVDETANYIKKNWPAWPM